MQESKECTETSEYKTYRNKVIKSIKQYGITTGQHYRERQATGTLRLRVEELFTHAFVTDGECVLKYSGEEVRMVKGD